MLFGGYGGSYRGDTWEWDGTVWVDKTPATSPSARDAHAMAYDSARGRIVLFGGTEANATVDSNIQTLGSGTAPHGSR